jgi:hypothetical protein
MLRDPKLLTRLALLFSGCLLMATACDDSGLQSPDGATPAPGQGAQACTLPTQCASGVCRDGFCAPAQSSNNGGQPGTGGGQTGGCVPNACGNCDANCQTGGVGDGTGTPFDFSVDQADGVVLNDDGHITLDSSRTEHHYVWIANTSQGTISKVDTRSFEEVARYLTGPNGAGNDPSRTSVNTYGDVFVGNRGGRSVTKISSGNCVDRNGDGVIRTSTGPNDILPWGEDECVIWNTSLPNSSLVRAVAAQDTDRGSYVWVGGWSGIVYKLDGETGQVLVETPSPHLPYGFAMDKYGNLWIATLSRASLGRIDTNRCIDNASCNVQPCGDDGDDCIKQLITAPSQHYGITVDFKQRVWLGGSVTRYDHAAPQGQRWASAQANAFITGISADELGWIYGAGMGSGIYRFDAENPTSFAVIQGTAGYSVRGVAIDMEGKAWGINLSHNNAQVVEPGPGLNDGRVIHTFTGLVGPYTYSDMTGSQLRFATNQRGIYSRVFEGCSPDRFIYNEWKEFHFDASVEPGATIRFRLRANHSRAAMEASEWIELGEVPGLTSPIDLHALLKPLGLERSQWLQVEAQLNSFRTETDLSVPTIRSMSVQKDCPPIIL